MSFWDFGRFGCIPSVAPQSRKVFGGVYSGSEGSWGNGDFGNLFLEDVRGKIHEFLEFREVMEGIK